MNVLITGGAGFIGSHIADLFVAEGFNVIIVDNFYSGSAQNIPNNCKVHNLDLNSTDLETIFIKEKPDIIIHLAAQVSVKLSMEDPLTDARTNILTTIRLLELSRKYKIKKFIFASTSAVYGIPNSISCSEESEISPLSFYGLSKHTSELYIIHYAKAYQLPFTIFRYSNVYGPRQNHSSEGGVIPIFVNHVVHQKAPIIYGDGKQTRDFIYVKDIARANLLAVHQGSNEIFNLSTSVETNVNDLWKSISCLGSFHAKPIYKKARTGEVKNSVLNNQKAKKMLNWQPTYCLKKGLEETYLYYQKKLKEGMQ